MTFQQKLDKIGQKNNSLLCIGLDPSADKFPFFNFNKKIIDVTSDLVCCYKPNSAFYEAFGERGIGELKKTCDYLRKKYPEIPIILDAKRGDIDSTNDGYATFAFDYLKADAITLNPYLGSDSLKPFLQRKDKGCIILCKTSNHGSGEFQDIRIKGKEFFKIVAEKVINAWNKNGNCMLVVGATYPKELQEIRKLEIGRAHV